MFDISAYLPDALIPAYNNFRKTIVTVLWILGIENGVAHDVSAGNSHIFQQNVSWLRNAQLENASAKGRDRPFDSNVKG